ncbi:MAG: protein kinase domain-containing protein, partial [Planctomycetota bacterium]
MSEVPPTDPDSTPTMDPASFGRSDQPSEDAQGGEGPGESILKKRLGPYEILGEIGRGGMGVVYKAFHQQLKRTVALKVLIAGEDASEEAIKRFQREAEAVAKLGHHPNIVPVHDIGVDGKTHYFAMHFVEGNSLDRLIDEGKITPKHAAVIGKKLADALAHAHAHGVLHRDIKPANVLMGTGGSGQRSAVSGETQEDTPLTAHRSSLSAELEPMLTDFGLAKDVASESKMTLSGMTLGTPQYMPPEQAKGVLDKVDERSDIYSLGATLFEMLTLQPPFEGSNVIEIIQKVLLKDPVSPRKGNPAVDRDLETICLKCLEKEPDQRYATVGALSRDLESWLEGTPIAARPAGWGRRILKKAKRHRGMVWTVAVASLLLIAGAVVAGIALAGLERRRESVEAAKAEADRQAQEEAQRADAEASRRAEEERRRLAVEVVLAAQVRLGAIHRDLKRRFYEERGDRGTPPQMSETQEKKIEKYFSTYMADRSDPAGPVSRARVEEATALALKAWLMRLGGNFEKARTLFRRSRELDPEAGWGWLLQAMVLLSGYLEGRRLPGFNWGGSRGIEFDPVPEENPKVRRIREAYEKLLASPFADRGSELCGMKKSELLAFVKAGGDMRACERALTSALEIPELFWVRSEMLIARARMRFQLKDFEGALEDLDELIEELPGCAWFHMLRGDMLIGR